jgi:hypothetical protein
MTTRGPRMNQRASAFFAEVVYSKTRVNAALQSYRNKQTDRTTLRSTVRRSQESDDISSGEQNLRSMNLFCRFFESIGKIRSEQTCCSDSSDLRHQPDRYSTICVDVEFRALAVRHGGLNGYQGQ